MFYNRIPGDSFTHSVQEAQPYSTPAGKGGASNYFSSLAQPFAAGSLGWSLSRWVDLTTGNGSGISQTTVQEIFVTPVTYSWNLNAQYEFLPSWVLEVGYVGSHGIHQNNTHPINTAQLASVSNPLYGIVTTNLRSNVPARVPYLGFSAATLSQESTDGDYKFNSLQATVRKQYSHGLTFQAAYTFSRAFANYAASTTSGRVSNDPLDSRQQYGLNANYRPHRLVLSYNWNIPTRKISGVAVKLIGGWSLSGLTPIQDGQPLTLTDTRGGTIYGQPGTSRAQINPGFTYADVLTPGDVKSNLNNYFNKAALGLTPVIGDGTGWGNTGIGIAFGPGQFDWDIALAKRTRVGGLREAPELQFRAEAVNLFNHAQFLNPGLAGNQGNFGLITGSSVNPRLLQLALKYVF